MSTQYLLSELMTVAAQVLSKPLRFMGKGKKNEWIISEEMGWGDVADCI
jgi:hypothetical protein